MNKIRVIELFAGVGGFRLGLEGYKGKSPLSGYKKSIKSNSFVPFPKRKDTCNSKI